MKRYTFEFYVQGEWHCDDETPSDKMEVVLADEADEAIRELVEAGRRVLGAVGYEGQLHEHDALHEFNAIIAKYEKEDV